VAERYLSTTANRRHLYTATGQSCPRFLYIFHTNGQVKTLFRDLLGNNYFRSRL